MMRIWVVMGVLMVACADDDAVQGPRDQRDAAVSDQFSGTVGSDVGQRQLDMFSTEDIYVPSSPTQDVNRPIWPEGADLSIERRGSEMRCVGQRRQMINRSVATAYMWMVNSKPEHELLSGWLCFHR